MAIQRCVRRFLTWRGVVKARMVSYLGRELDNLQQMKHLEQYQLASTADIDST